MAKSLVLWFAGIAGIIFLAISIAGFFFTTTVALPADIQEPVWIPQNSVVYAPNERTRIFESIEDFRKAVGQGFIVVTYNDSETRSGLFPAMEYWNVAEDGKVNYFSMSVSYPQHKSYPKELLVSWSPRFSEEERSFVWVAERDTSLFILYALFAFAGALFLFMVMALFLSDRSASGTKEQIAV